MPVTPCAAQPCPVIAAENLEGGSGMASRTIASMEHGWSQGRDLLTSRDVLVIDEAGMVGTRQLERVRSHAAEAGAPAREQARGELIDRWDRERQANPDATRIILTHTNAEVRELNGRPASGCATPANLARTCMSPLNGARGPSHTATA